MYTLIFTPALALLLTTTLTLASPLAPRSALTTTSLLAVAPKSATCDPTAPHAADCKTATDALPAILQSFQSYKISDPATQAAVLSTIVFESGEFKYANHYFPSTVPGQGTRNMQSADFNLKYAQSISALKDKLPAAQAKGPQAVTDLLVRNIDYDFASAAWFLVSQCDAGTVSRLKNAGEAAFDKYLACIGTAATPDRSTYYNKALTAMGVKSS